MILVRAKKPFNSPLFRESKQINEEVHNMLRMIYIAIITKLHLRSYILEPKYF